MNNYCTNCGNKLEKTDLVCKNCNTPVIDLPYNYKYKSKKKQKRLLIIIGTCILCIIAFFSIKEIIYKTKINKMQKKYVEPYLKENYSNLDYSIKYDSSGKCIISGDCYFDPVKGCDGGVCNEYSYLNEKDCKSYYYSINSDTKEFILTVVDRNNQFFVVEGKNIYGKDKENDEETNSNYSDEEINNKLDDNSSHKDISYKNIIDKYPYESNYYNFNSIYKDNQLYLDNNDMIMNFFTGILSDNTKLYISGHIANPMYLKGNIYMTTKYYDQKYNEIGICNDTIKLLGEGYSNISFSCHILESELANSKSFEDVAYYKINISSLNVNE